MYSSIRLINLVESDGRHVCRGLSNLLWLEKAVSDSDGFWEEGPPVEKHSSTSYQNSHVMASHGYS